MRITAKELRKIIKEEVEEVLMKEEELDEGLMDKIKEYAEVIKRELIDNGVAVAAAGTLALSIANILHAGGANIDPAKAVALLGAVGTAVQAGLKVAELSDISGGDMFSQVKPD
jgi:hypothetical protein